jgi:hypothetical protein
MTKYKFIKTGNDWYIDLPEYIEQGGSIGDLQMVEGTDKMLDMMAGTHNTVLLTLAKEPFEGADMLELTEKCDPNIGGGYYLMKFFEGEAINSTMWLCQVTEFVFNDIPPRIFVRREHPGA